jgi:hypothetical protein
MEIIRDTLLLFTGNSKSVVVRMALSAPGGDVTLSILFAMALLTELLCGQQKI